MTLPLWLSTSILRTGETGFKAQSGLKALWPGTKGYDGTSGLSGGLKVAPALGGQAWAAHCPLSTAQFR